MGPERSTRDVDCQGEITDVSLRREISSHPLVVGLSAAQKGLCTCTGKQEQRKASWKS